MPRSAQAREVRAQYSQFVGRSPKQEIHLWSRDLCSGDWWHYQTNLHSRGLS